MRFIFSKSLPAWTAMLPSELKNEEYFKSSNCTLGLPLTTGTSSLAINSTGSAAEIVVAAAAEDDNEAFTPEAELLDHEAATIWATPMLLQLRRALVLSWRTKLGGNFNIKDDRPPPKNEVEAVPFLIELTRRENRPWLGWSVPDASERHSKAAAEVKILGHGQEETAIFSSGGENGRRRKGWFGV